MKIHVTSPPMANDTAYGYELRYLDFARSLMDAGVTVQDLQEHQRDFGWALDIVSKQVTKEIRSCYDLR